MPYYKYADLFEHAQKNKQAPYKMFVFDLKNSTKMEHQKRANQQYIMLQTMDLVTEKLLNLSNTKNKPILLQNEEVYIEPKQKNTSKKANWIVSYLQNPCVLSGDSYCFYVYNNSITEKEFLTIFNHCSQQTQNFYTYRFLSAQFETTKYNEGDNKYYIGYCVKELTKNKQLPQTIINIEQQETLLPNKSNPSV